MKLRSELSIAVRIVLLFAIVLVTACASIEKDEPSNGDVIDESSNGGQIEEDEPSDIDVIDESSNGEQIEEDEPSNRIVIGESSNGEQVEVPLGGTLAVILDSNPSTGYNWEIEELDESMLQQDGDISFRYSIPDNPPPGTGGTMTIRFEAIGEGESELRLIHHRPGTNDEPLAILSVQVVVR